MRAPRLCRGARRPPSGCKPSLPLRFSRSDPPKFLPHRASFSSSRALCAVIDRHDDILCVISEFLPENIDTAHVMRRGFYTDLERNARFFPYPELRKRAVATISIIQISTVLRNDEFFQNAVLRGIERPPIRRICAAGSAEIPRRSPFANFGIVDPKGDIRRKLVSEPRSLRTTFQ